MKVKFYGVRGSIPTPGPEYSKIGGNTACVHVELNDGTDIVLDSGTGARLLGKKLLGKDTPIYFLLSHNHWDHIQGFPFFAPAYQKDRKIIITPGQTKENRPEAILEQMTGSFFPVPREALGADISFHIPDNDKSDWMIGEAKISRMPMNHPGGGSCYCIQEGNSKLAYVTDNELYPPYQKEGDFQEFVNFVKNADLLIHDAQYIVQDMPAKHGWGHSVAEEAVKLAMAAQTKTLALYSHDPERTDKDVESITQHADDILHIGGADQAICIAAYEGLTLPI
ncbi:MBL fold metallo-hydrolase [Glaciecola sp. 1036]|uniref:MBL fold metallo-hydrolase n=1 Tax=Alteromonadaceae TaxID=72275 RepID=UPI003D01208A